ncbi:MAG: BREX-1 system adenine-specific DNA-methyltransferase PglX, partial [Anaerolineae bacterium]|nr:BREX-1 system adenine-specific DNA-methyltransferase PglX [Anaerolineae bacterium]
MPETVRQLALSLETHRNHFLFSDHYLTEVLLQQPEWRMVEAETRQALEAITALYDRHANSLPHYNEAEAEEHWIRPVLKILCHAYEVQPSLPGALGTPDYALFANEDNRHAAAPNLGKPAYWESALSVADAKRWERPLDKRIVNGATDAFTNANPCYQIDYYLRHTGCTWGVLSNGRQWRLFHHDSSFRLDVYYEVDLVQLIEQGNLAAFRYFYLFFRAAAFRPDAEGCCWLDDVLAQSTAYAVRVGDELKGQVYEALRLLAQGFLDYPTGDPESAFDPATDLPRVHDACLILLYRLLFLLYAESRDLLPLTNPGYARQYSLKAIKEEIAQKLDNGVVYLARKATIWDDLRTLFEIIYSGQEALGVPAYNGGLFDPSHYPFLEGQAIGDQYLAGAIDLLSRAKAGLHRERSAERRGQGLSFVDYRDLSIRHLGSIYEGLLEYKLAYAAEEMAVVKGRKHEEIVSASGAGEDKVVERIPAGRVYLVTDRGERKATGSYYTPDYIVKYIVEQTLGPLVDAQAEAVEGEIATLKARSKGGARRTKIYKETLVRLQNSFADRVLALNALDPAMGSGHFLVEATDYLARRIVEAGVVTEALANGDEESELSYWRRRVVERCIYGVDLNPLAVELAKLSLWLATVAKGKPLSFLDHHLRCGNSLIGARVVDLRALPVRKKRRRKTSEVSQTSEVSEVLQLAMWDESTFTQDMFRVVGAMRQIQDYVTDDLVSVKEKERLFEETVERERRKWHAVADLWTATYFGLELAPELYNACVRHVQGKPVLLQAAQAEALLTQANQIWEQKRFFHWEIEFPEVFFDQYGRHKGDEAGFDAVVGNPPYVRATDDVEFQSLKQQLKRLGSSVHMRGKMMYETLHLKWDLYIPFLEQAYNLLAARGLMGLIIPDSYAVTPYATKSRTLFATQATIQHVDHFPDVFLFPGVSVYNMIVVCERARPDPKHVPTRMLHTDANDISRHVSLPPITQEESPRTLFSPLQMAVRFDRVRTIALGKLCYINKGGTLQSHDIKFRGLFRKVDLLSDVKDPSHPKPYVEGKNIGQGFIETVRYLEYGEGTRNPAMVMESRFPEMFENEKLLFGKTSGVYWDQGYLWCDQSARV